MPQAHTHVGRGREAVATALLISAAIVHISLLVSWRWGWWNRFTFDATATQGRRGWDFYAVYQAGHNVLDGVSAYESDNDKIDVVVPLYTPFRYLPISAYTLGVALNALPPLWAFRLWVAFTEATLLTCACVSGKLVRDRLHAAILVSMWLAFTPFYLEIYLGQFSVVQAALVLAMMVLVVGDKTGLRCDLAWIASLLWKQNTGLFVPLYLRLRRWRALALAACAVGITSVPYFVLYLGALAAFLANFWSSLPSHQLGDLGMRQFLFSLVSWLAPRLTAQAHVAFQGLWVAMVTVSALWLTFRGRHPDPVLLLCLWTTTFTLVYHQVWEHHYVMLLPVLVMLFSRSSSPVVLILYILLAVWTPYVLIDPGGQAAYHGPMRWTPLEPRILDAWYHASKSVPALLLWLYNARLLLLAEASGRAT